MQITRIVRKFPKNQKKDKEWQKFMQQEKEKQLLQKYG